MAFDEMRVVSALSGEILAESNVDAQCGEVIDEAAAALGKSRRLLRATVSECRVVLLAGKISCRRCRRKICCGCGAPAADCGCADLEEEDCSDCEAEMAAWEDSFQSLKETSW